MKTRNIFGVFVATLLYFLTIGIVTKSLSSHFSHVATSLKQDTYASVISSSFVLQYSQNENVTDSNQTISTTVFKNPFLGFFVATSIANEQFYKNTFSNYVKRSINTLVHYRKTDIIFPFHYFW